MLLSSLLYTSLIVMSKEIIVEFAAYLKNAERSQSTVIAYSKDLEQLMQYSEVEVHLLDHAQLNEIMQKMISELSFTPKTISRKLNSFRMFYKFLQENGKISHNPAEKIDHPRFTPKESRVLSSMEYLALREVTRSNSRLYMMIELMLQTGIRIGELSRLKIKDVHLDSTKPHLFIEEFSTNAAREVPVNAKLASELKTYIASLPPKYTENSPVFATREGKSIIIRNIRSSVDRAMIRAGIENACVNDLRNTFIVTQLKAGVPIDLVAEVVGHRSRVTTNKYLGFLGQEYKPNGENRIVEL